MKAIKIGSNLLTVDGIQKAVSEGKMQSWVRNDSLGVTELVEHHSGLVVNVVLAVGERNDILALNDEIKKFARKHGAKMIRFEGRPGWSAFLPQLGYRKVPNVIYEMEIKNAD